MRRRTRLWKSPQPLALRGLYSGPRSGACCWEFCAATSSDKSPIFYPKKSNCSCLPDGSNSPKFSIRTRSRRVFEVGNYRALTCRRTTDNMIGESLKVMLDVIEKLLILQDRD